MIFCINCLENIFWLLYQFLCLPWRKSLSWSETWSGSDFAAIPCFQLRAEAEIPSSPKVKRGLLPISFHPQHPVFAPLNTRNRNVPASSANSSLTPTLSSPCCAAPSDLYTSPYPPALHPAPPQRTAPNHSYIGLILLPSRRNNLLVACP